MDSVVQSKGGTERLFIWGMVLTKAALAPQPLRSLIGFKPCQLQPQPTLGTHADTPCSRLQLVLGPVLKSSGLPKEPALPHTMLRMWCPKPSPL